MDTEKYKSIRPLTPNEVPEAIRLLTSLEPLRAVYESLGMELSWTELQSVLSSCQSVEDFKRRVSYYWVKHIMAHCCRSVELTGTEHISPTGAYTYISNHRDIILDSAFLNVLLVDASARFPQIAIGDNLMIYPWVETLVKLNGSFLVRRNLEGREVLLAAKLLSEYMHEAVSEGESLWIAQREGRAKDSSDQTQPALLKMLSLGAKSREPIAALTPLNILPVTCSYEYDPCDYLKAQEMQLKRDVAGFKKSPEDDGINMKTGVFGWKGRVTFHLGRPLSELLVGQTLPEEPQARYTALASVLDREIHRGYCLYPINYVAADELLGSPRYSEHYTPEERREALAYIEQRIALVQLPEPLMLDVPFLREALLRMYANPVYNQTQANDPS